MNNFLQILENGEMIIIPTETVFGIAVRADNDRAINNIYKVKKRSEQKPLQIMVSDIAMAKKYAVFNDKAESLANKYWPGSLTMILRSKVDTKLSTLLDHNGTIGLRIPNNEKVLDLLRSIDVPLAVTSANISNESPLLDLYGIKDVFGDDIAILDNKNSNFSGIASTVIDITSDNVRFLRDGNISRGELLSSLL